MDLFENILDPIKFKATNALWNELKLNSPWSVGYVANLIESTTFDSKESWKEFYYRSGEQRLNRIMSSAYREELEDFTSPNTNAPYIEKQNNFKYGRTEENLKQKGIYLFEELQKRGNPLEITKAECIYAVKFRVIGETWNGIILREKNTIQELQKLYPYAEFVKTSGEMDYKYAIDYELYEEGKLISAIQIKPPSYKNGNSEEILIAKSANIQKNKEYTEAFGVDVFYIYSTQSGEIISEEINCVSEDVCESRRTIDMDAERELGLFLDANFYRKLLQNKIINEFTRIKDKKTQLSGIDVIMVTNKNTVRLDEKAQLYYINRRLPTFAFEVNFLNKSGILSLGWLYNTSLLTDYFVLIWPSATHNDLKTIKADDFTDVECLIISKAAIVNYLSESGYTEETISVIVNDLRSQELYGKHALPNQNNFYLYFSEPKNYSEQPINIVIKKDTLMQLAACVYIVSKNNLIRVK